MATHEALNNFKEKQVILLADNDFYCHEMAAEGI
jgi:hypothetical protein